MCASQLHHQVPQTKNNATKRIVGSCRNGRDQIKKLHIFIGRQTNTMNRLIGSNYCHPWKYATSKHLNEKRENTMVSGE